MQQDARTEIMVLSSAAPFAHTGPLALIFLPSPPVPGVTFTPHPTRRAGGNACSAWISAQIPALGLPISLPGYPCGGASLALESAVAFPAAFVLLEG